MNKGDFTICIKLPKNVFYYDEPKPYEIDLKYKELNSLLKDQLYH